jgi:hypothetical protein
LKDIEQSVLQKSLIEIVENGFYHTENVRNLLIKSLNASDEEEIILKEPELS